MKITALALHSDALTHTRTHNKSQYVNVLKIPKGKHAIIL